VFFLSGIDYLHSSKPTVVHQSISADKVLLDNLCALRLADADLHKLLADDVVFSTLKYSTAMGYLAPEYAATGRFTDKVTCTHLAWSCSRCSLGAGAYRTSAASRVESGRLDDLIDPRLGGWFSRLVVARLTGIALLCTSELLIRILSKQFLLK
jgi:hypothetical protein